MKSFNDITALISGASSGIGLGLAKALAAEGARVAITGTRPEKLAAASAVLKDAGAQVITLRFDVADVAAWVDAAKRVEDELGPIQFLALNAGISALGKPIAAATPEDWRASWDFNFMGVANGMHACLPAMRAHGKPGHIMVTSSLGGVVPFQVSAPYCSMKAAAVMLAECLKQELALENSPLSASVMCPGAVRTDFVTTSNRHVGGLVPSDVAAYITANLEQLGLDPDEVGRFTLERIRAGDFYIFPHNEGREVVTERYESSIAAMNFGAKPTEYLPADAAAQ